MTRVRSPITALPRETICDNIAVFARDIKLSHSIFALPWALLATFLAAGGLPAFGQILLIVLCMVSARTVAMASNRLLDAELDAQNPRTARRAIPSGALTSRFVLIMLLLCSFAFIAATAFFGVIYANWLPLMFCVPVLLFISAYPLLKRFSQTCHYYLGAALALAPVCAWVAVAGDVTITPLLIAGAVLLWTAGFDIIYACQDYHSDLATGVISVPVRFGIGGALWISRVTHIACAMLMIGVGLSHPQLRTLYFIGTGGAILLLLVEHAMVKSNDLSRVGLAFFTINGVISLLVGTLGIVDVFV